MMSNCSLHRLLIALLFSLGASTYVTRVVSETKNSSDTPTLRHPVALAFDRAGRWLYVANQQSGTITVVDASTGKPKGEQKIGSRLADLIAAPDGNHLLTVDERAHELLLLSCRGAAVRIEKRVKVSPYPVSVCL